MRPLPTAAAVILALAGPASAAPTILTFDSPADCTGPAVTITEGAGGTPCFVYTFVGASANGTPMLQLTQSLGTFWTAAFATPASGVSVDLGDNGSDPDALFLRGFVGDQQVEEVTDVLPQGEKGTRTLALLGSGFTSIVFGVEGATGLQADNLTFESEMRPIPLPAGGVLLLGALGALALRRRTAR